MCSSDLHLVKAAVAWRTGQSGAPATSPGRWISTVGASVFWGTGQSGGAPDRSCRLSGAPFGVCSDLCAHCSAFNVLCRRPLVRSSRCSAGAPNSPMNYSGAAPRIPEGEQFGVEFPGAPDTVRWHTGLSGAPDQGTLRLSFALFVSTLSWSFYWFIVNLWHL